MVFNDGGWYVAPDGPIRVPAVVDSLVHSGELGPTVAVFVAAGVPDGAEGGMGDLATFRQRSVEYDTCDGTFAAFLEMRSSRSPRAHGRSFTSDPSRRMIGGISSGGICAFNAAWHRPDVVRARAQPLRVVHGAARRAPLSVPRAQHRPEADQGVPAERRPRTWTRSSATGRSRTARWRRRWSTRATTTGSSSEPAATA